MEQPDYTPRKYARKDTKESLKGGIRLALDYEQDSVRRNTNTFNIGRYKATGAIDDYEVLKEKARAIKEDSIARLPDLIQTLQSTVEQNGGSVYLASDAEDATQHIKDLCSGYEAELVVKSKSMTTEEIHLNTVLESAGMEVVETDLGEMIIQIADEQPSHIVGPAIHRSREQISTLFKRVYDTDSPLDSGEALTKYARDILREKFLNADIGITGANAIAAESGTLMLVESEANIRMVMQTPPIHIAVAGVEKIVPSKAHLFPFIELLGPSGTGQPLTSYTNLVTPPLDVRPFSFREKPVRPRAFHLVLIDNGRMNMREDPMLREALYCIRCAACLNSCANFQNLGGHAYGGETYSGGIGSAWESGTHGIETAKFNELCTGCSRCKPQCPVKIDIPWLNIVLRDRINQSRKKDPFSFVYRGLLDSAPEDTSAPLQKQFFGNYATLAKWGSRLAPLSNWIANTAFSKTILEKLVGLASDADLPRFASQNFTTWYRHSFRTLSSIESEQFANYEVVFFPDIYVNYLHPSWGISAIRVLKKLGMTTTVMDTLPDGRAALSQGMVNTASERAKVLAETCREYLESDRDIIVVEPSVLGMFREDYSHLLPDGELLGRLLKQSFEPIEYIFNLGESVLDKIADFIKNQDNHQWPDRVFYHSHCQQRSANAADQTVALLQSLGFHVITSSVECCGMAGSFGYKQDYYEVSQEVGINLVNQIESAESDTGKCLLLASGTSCTDQIQSLTGRKVFHPLELLDSLLLD
ncbi:MAG: LUD domain-containing protein [Candidatus Marinimicrobia bacterium]|nr:LUD domain-containing protein [Candidatus Neomarinimicrobiota bacterium]MCF7828308.1 LUD domain-containing protein [Candidatus Neomarinimicrobiota bacterium]MCF7879517.1 LUD domain-containing protein [Candidatus Neomarinimicrobiota bacterium]